MYLLTAKVVNILVMQGERQEKNNNFNIVLSLTSAESDWWKTQGWSQGGWLINPYPANVENMVSF